MSFVREKQGIPPWLGSATLLWLVISPWLGSAILMWLVTSGCAVAGFMRYGLVQGKFGNLREGDPAPDAVVVSTDGAVSNLHDFVGEKPLVLVFGSFT